MPGAEAGLRPRPTLMLATFKLIPGNSFVHRLDPRTKFLVFLLFTADTIFIDDVRVLAAVLVVAFVYYLAARLPWRQTWKAWLVVLFFSLVIIGLFSTTLFGQAPSFITTAHPWFSFPTVTLPLIGTIHRTVTWEIAVFGLVRMLRPLVIMAVVLPFFLTTDPLYYGVTFRQLGLPDNISFAMDLAFRYVPTIARDFFVTVDAQRARGYELERSAGGILNQIRRAAPLIVPVTISSIAAGEEIVDAMDLRAFGVGKRTWLQLLRMAPQDWAVLSLAILLFLVLLGLRLFTPYGRYWFPAFLFR